MPMVSEPLLLFALLYLNLPHSNTSRNLSSSNSCRKFRSRTHTTTMQYEIPEQTGAVSTGRGELSKTLVGDFDENAVLLKLCLGRVERDINDRVLEVEREKLAIKKLNAASRAAAGGASLRGSYREGGESVHSNDSSGLLLPQPSSVVSALTTAVDSNRTYITNAAGRLQDVTHRRSMGSQPDELLHTRDAFLHRSDLIVARSALVRLTGEAARLADSMRAAHADKVALLQDCEEQRATIAQQGRRIRFLEEMLHSALDSVRGNMVMLGEGEKSASNATSATTEMSDLSWAQHFALGRVAIDEGDDKFKALYAHWQRRLEQVGGLEGEVAERRSMLEHFRSETDDIVRGMAHDDDLGDTSTGIGGGGSTVATFVKPLSGETQSALEEQRRQSTAHLANHVQHTAHTKVTSLNRVRELVKEADRPVQFTAEHDEEHFVIRRDIGSSNVRVVRKQGASSSIVGRIITAILYAPATALHLQVHMETTTGRRQQLVRQAAEANFSELWEQLSLYSNPFIQLVTVSGEAAVLQREGGIEGGSSGGGRGADVRDLLVTDDGDVDEFPERRIQREKRQAFRRLNEGLLSGKKPIGFSPSRSRDGCQTFGQEEGEQLLEEGVSQDARRTITSMAVASPSGAPKQTTAPLVQQQHPGLIYLVATDCGKKPWSNPLRSGAIRVAVSSVLPPAKVEAIVSPFVDPRSSYFSTRNEPGQFFSVAFDRMVVVPTAYSLASTHPISGGDYPRNWRFDGSCDGINWTLLRRHVNDESLSRRTPTFTWQLQRTPQSSTFYTMFRVVAEGPNITGGDALCATCLEVYGKLAYVVEDPFPELEPVSAPAPRPAGFASMGGLPTIKEPKKGKKK